MSRMGQAVPPIPAVAPVPSILTTARDRTNDGFATTAPAEVKGPVVEGAAAPSTDSWRDGVSWTSLSCQQSHIQADCPDAGDRDAPDGNTGREEAAPFWIYTPLSCEWALHADVLDQAAKDLTAAHSAFGVARALWFGEGLDPGEPPLATLRNSATDVAPGVSFDLDDAFAQLLAAYQDATQQGGAVLHVPSILIPGALGGVPGGSVVIKPEGQTYRGPLSSLVVPGPGYPNGASSDGVDGNGPILSAGPPVTYKGNLDDQLWIYITGPVEYALGPISVMSPTPGLILRRNVHEVWAQRQAIVRFDPCSTFACLVNNYTAKVGS